MYSVYIGGLLLPVTPKTISYTMNNRNFSLSLLEGEVNVLQKKGLTSISFDALLPSVPYPFAIYEKGFLYPIEIIESILRMKDQKTSIPLKITRKYPSGALYFDTHLYISIEHIAYKEAAAEGRDILLSLTCKEFKAYGVKRFIIAESTKETRLIQADYKKTYNALNTTYTVKNGDTLWGICQKQLGAGEKYQTIATLNHIKDPHKIYPGQVIFFE